MKLIKPFYFKQFTLQQSHSAMKVGTDGTLLGAWVDCQQATRILDIGTGTGLIALMLAQRNLTAWLEALEIDPDAAQEAQDNIENSPWGERIHVHQTALQTFTPDYKYDLIVCNPPFFNHSHLSPSLNRNLARHTQSLSHAELLLYSLKLLADQGCLAVVLPLQEGQKFIQLAENEELYLIEHCLVQDKPEQVAKRLLLRFGKEKQESKVSILTLKDKNGNYSQDYQDLLRDFLIIF